MAGADNEDSPAKQETTAEVSSPESPSAAPLRLPRTSLALLSLLHAAVFAWAAKALPWDDWTAFALIAGALALLHLTTAVLSMLRHRLLALVWRLQAAVSTLLLVYVGWGLFSSAWYVSHVYGGLGQGLAAALLAVFGLVVLLTAPIALWGWLTTGGIRLGKVGGATFLLVLLLAGLRLHHIADQAEGEALVDQASMNEMGDLLRSLADSPRKIGRAPRSSLMTRHAAPCGATPNRLTLVVSALKPGSNKEKSKNRKKKRKKKRQLHSTTRCLTADKVSDLRAPLEELLSKTLGQVKFDLLKTRYQPPEEAWLASLSFRPGLDGACSGERCFMPWQLAALDMFTTHKIIPAVPDARLGISLLALRKRLALKDTQAPITRVSTTGWLLRRDGKVVEQGRVLRPAVEVTPSEIAQAELLARSYILAAQKRDGTFRYMTQPHTGYATNRGFSVPRQAGTTMILCELGAADRRVQRAAQRSLDLLASLEQNLPATKAGQRSLLIFPKGAKPNKVGLGASALSMVAALRCRPLVDRRYDGLIGRLARTLLSQQRADGSFLHKVDPRDGKPVAALGSLYVDGQAVLALTLLEAVAEENNDAFPSPSLVHDAVERAMEFYGNQYWHTFIRPFLFLEENWHCLAAAASLKHHRHDGYERFCLDYVRFKSRIVLDHDAGVSDDFIGGYAFGNIVPPHNTATAGFGEALAAAMKVRAVRGETRTEDADNMRLVVGFLLRNQWRGEVCYACSPKQIMAGGFSEHMASPNIRIDYVQHAWAAIGHGARAAGWLRDDTGDAAAGAGG